MLKSSPHSFLDKEHRVVSTLKCASWSFKGSILELPSECPNRGDGERCGEVGCGVGEGVRASGESGMLPADLRLPDRYRCPLSLGARPWRVLGRMCPDPAGELGALELGELLWEELVPVGGKQNTVSNGQLPFSFHASSQTVLGKLR